MRYRDVDLFQITSTIRGVMRVLRYASANLLTGAQFNTDNITET